MMLIQTDERWELVAGIAFKIDTERLYKDLKACKGRRMNLLIRELPCSFVT